MNYDTVKIPIPWPQLSTSWVSNNEYDPDTIHAICNRFSYPPMEFAFVIPERMIHVIGRENVEAIMLRNRDRVKKAVAETFTKMFEELNAAEDRIRSDFMFKEWLRLSLGDMPLEQDVIKWYREKYPNWKDEYEIACKRALDESFPDDVP